MMWIMTLIFNFQILKKIHLTNDNYSSKFQFWLQIFQQVHKQRVGAFKEWFPFLDTTIELRWF